MPIMMNCPHCRHMLKVPDDKRGKRVKCPKCEGVVETPGSAGSREESPPPRAREPEPDLADLNLEIEDSPPPRTRPVEEPPEEPRRREREPERKRERRGALDEALDEVHDSRRSDDEDDEEWLDHSDEYLPSDVVYLAPPPRDIGKVTSAYSSLLEGQKPLPTPVVLLSCFFFTAIGLAIGIAIDYFANLMSWWMYVWPTVFGLGGLFIGYAIVSFGHHTSYVGEQGVSRFECSGSTENLTEETFQFRDAAELRVAITDHYTNGVYQHTAYSYEWTNVAGTNVYTIEGSHSSQEGTPEVGDEYYFALAAQAQWTKYSLEDAFRQLEISDSIKFNLTGKDWVRLGDGFIVFNQGGEPVKIPVEKIEDIEMASGTFKLKRKGAREGWFSSEGVYQFQVADMANSQLFFILMERLLGYSFD